MWGGLTSYDETNLRSCCESVFESRQMFSDSLMMLGLKSPVADIYNIYIYLHVKSWKVVVKVQFQALDSCKFKLFAGLVLSSSVRIIWDYIYIYTSFQNAQHWLSLSFWGQNSLKGSGSWNIEERLSGESISFAWHFMSHRHDAMSVLVDPVARWAAKKVSMTMLYYAPACLVSWPVLRHQSHRYAQMPERTLLSLIIHPHLKQSEVRAQPCRGQKMAMLWLAASHIVT